VFIEAKDDGGGSDYWTTGAISCADVAKLLLLNKHLVVHPLMQYGASPT